MAAEMPKDRYAYRLASGWLIVVFGVSCVAHDRFHARKAALGRMCLTLVASNGTRATQSAEERFG